MAIAYYGVYVCTKTKKRERKLVKTMAKLRMAHASTHGARKPPGPTNWIFWGDKGRKGQKKYLLLGLSQKQIFIFLNLISDFLGNKGICNI